MKLKNVAPHTCCHHIACSTHPCLCQSRTCHTAIALPTLTHAPQRAVRCQFIQFILLAVSHPATRRCQFKCTEIRVEYLVRQPHVHHHDLRLTHEENADHAPAVLVASMAEILVELCILCIETVSHLPVKHVDFVKKIPIPC